MKVSIPKGGFFAVRYTKEDTAAGLIRNVENMGYETLWFQSDKIILGSNREFQGQGVWENHAGGAVAYDIDLTNSKELKLLVDIPKQNDGALLWALYTKYGLDFIDRLRGAFAFALWDRDKQRMVVVTDPFGIRPVVFTEKNGGYFAASRIKTLLALPGIQPSFNPDAIYHYLFFHAICSPLTIYNRIKKLEPGKGHLISERGFKDFRHYDIKYHIKKGVSEKEWRKATYMEVKNAVNVFVPLSPYEKTGCFLSGGTDSSTIAGMYTQLSGKSAKTFSIGFDDPKYNELEYAKLAVSRFGTDQTEYFVTPQDTLDLITSLSDIYDEPFGNASVVPAYYCANAAKDKGVDVLLGGDGGDEIFGGNERYVTNLVFSQYHKIPRIIRKFILEPALKMMPDIGFFYKASRYVRRANFNNPYRFFSYNLLAEEDNSEILTESFSRETNIDAFMDLAKAHYERTEQTDDTNRLLYLDMKFTITDNDLRKVTQMAEAAGVRVRYPYLDRDLVDFTTTIPSDLKIKYGKNRYLFKKAMENFLPDQIIAKPKHGMGLPISNWFRTEKILRELLFDSLFTGTPIITSYIKQSYLNSLYRSFEEDVTTAFYGDILWVYLVLELWLKRN